jgi:putative hydrolase of the HAD superfamily
VTRPSYPTILFDWGDTVMRDDPASTIPMAEWPTIHVIEGIAETLAYLHASGLGDGLKKGSIFLPGSPT